MLVAENISGMMNQEGTRVQAETDRRNSLCGGLLRVGADVWRRFMSSAPIAESRTAARSRAKSGFPLQLVMPWQTELRDGAEERAWCCPQNGFAEASAATCTGALPDLRPQTRLP